MWRCRRLGKFGPHVSCATIRPATEPARAVFSPPLYQERQGPALRISPTARPWNPRRMVARKAWLAGRHAGGRGPGKAGAVGSLQERALKVELIIGAGTVALGKEAAQMFNRLEERIGLRASRGLLLPAER